MVKRGVTLLTLMAWNPEILDGIAVPMGMNRELLKDAIFERCLDLDVIYEEPKVFSLIAESWFKRNLENFQKLWDSFTVVYDPLLEIDMDYKSGDHNQFTSNVQRSGTLGDVDKDSVKIVRDRKDETVKVTDNVDNIESNSEGSVAAFNSDTYSPDAKNVSTGTNTFEQTDHTTYDSDSNDTTDRNRTLDRTTSNTENKSDESQRDTWRTEKGRGKTAMELLENQRKVSAFNCYEHIAVLFERKFCVGVYS